MYFVTKTNFNSTNLAENWFLDIRSKERARRDGSDLEDSKFSPPIEQLSKSR
jgi:hypothetical protein